MPLVLPCPSCHKKLRAEPTLVGKRVKCPGCGHVFVFPAVKGTVVPAHEEAIAKTATAAPPKEPIARAAFCFVITPTSPPNAVDYLKTSWRDFGHPLVNPFLVQGTRELWTLADPYEFAVFAAKKLIGQVFDLDSPDVAIEACTITDGNGNKSIVLRAFDPRKTPRNALPQNYTWKTLREGTSEAHEGEPSAKQCRANVSQDSPVGHASSSPPPCDVEDYCEHCGRKGATKYAMHPRDPKQRRFLVCSADCGAKIGDTLSGLLGVEETERSLAIPLGGQEREFMLGIVVGSPERYCRWCGKKLATFWSARCGTCGRSV